jgi:protein ECT2
MDEEEKIIIQKKRICLVGPCSENSKLLEALEAFKIPIICSETGLEFIHDHKWTTYFVLNQFEGDIFDKIYKSKQK